MTGSRPQRENRPIIMRGRVCLLLLRVRPSYLLIAHPSFVLTICCLPTPPCATESSTIRIANSSFSQPQSQTASRSIPGLTEQTKKQRQNARKAAELKAAKEEAEHERLQRLAAHKRALERERMEEQNIPKGRQPAPQVQRSRREDVGGGMRAAVHDGKLIWE